MQTEIKHVPNNYWEDYGDWNRHNPSFVSKEPNKSDGKKHAGEQKSYL